MTKEESLYQVKLILDCLSDEEYFKIPGDVITYIEQNMKYSDEISINPDIPLEKQNIDEKTYDFLEKIIKEININETNNSIKKNENSFKDLEKNELIEILNKYVEENKKIPKAKELIKEYTLAIEEKNTQIENLKSVNQELYTSIKKCPKLIRRLFFKNFSDYLLN